MNLPTTSSLNHPELEEDEIFLLNIAPEEFERFNTSRPKWVKSLRMGKIAYKTNSTVIVTEFVPLFAKITQEDK